MHKSNALILTMSLCLWSAAAPRLMALDLFTPLPSTYNIGNEAHGIAFDGANWHVANFASPWRVFDTSFVSTGSFPPPPGVTIRGMAYDIGRGTLLLGGYSNQLVYVATTAGAVVTSFPTGLASGFNALAVDENTGTYWLEGFGGDFRNVTSTGGFISTFTTPGLNWTGLAYDSGRDTLLMMETNGDVVYEYSPAGVQLGIVVTSDAVAGNGQGLAYDSATGVLHATGQSGAIALWSRSPAFPPPTCTLVAPAGPVTGDALLMLDAQSMSSATVDATFEYSIDGGVTFALCTPSSLSTLVSNPALGIATGAADLLWDTMADGVGVSVVAAGVITRATIDDGASTINGECTGVGFDVDNTALCQGICGDCNESGTGPEILDALVAAQYAAGIGIPTMAQMGCCDVNSSGAIEVLDALRMAQAAAGLVVTLTCP